MPAFTAATNLHEAEKDGKMLFEDPCGTKVNLWAFLVRVRKHAMSRWADVLARAELMILQMPKENRVAHCKEERQACATYLR